jgi:hypothetical protein
VDPFSFLRSSRVVIVAGKGGVGKTTVTAALARLAASEGLTTLVVEVEGKSGLAGLFGRAPLTYRESVLWPASPDGGAEVRGRTLTPDEALLEYMEDHGLRRISKRLAASGAIDVVSTAVPGIKDILVLGRSSRSSGRATSTSSSSTPPPPATPSPSCWPPARCSTPCGWGRSRRRPGTCSSCWPTPSGARWCS